MFQRLRGIMLQLGYTTSYANSKPYFKKVSNIVKEFPDILSVIQAQQLVNDLRLSVEKQDYTEHFSWLRESGKQPLIVKLSSVLLAHCFITGMFKDVPKFTLVWHKKTRHFTQDGE